MTKLWVTLTLIALVFFAATGQADPPEAAVPKPKAKPAEPIRKSVTARVIHPTNAFLLRKP